MAGAHMIPLVAHAANTLQPPAVASAFGLSATQWTAIAAAAQACAALGAISLLIITLLSKAQAEAAVAASNKLAGHTEELVAATRDAQALAVRPVIEIRRDDPSRQLWITNAGNGPLLEPYISGASERTRLTGSANGVYGAVGALRPGEQAFMPLTADVDLAAVLLHGHTLVGNELTWEIAGARQGADTIVAKLADSAILAKGHE